MTARPIALTALALALSAPLAAMAGPHCSGIDVAHQPRLQVPLFQYSGTNSAQMQDHFTRYRSIIGVKMETLVEEISGQEGDPSSAPPGEVQVPAYYKKIALDLRAGAPQSDTLTTPSARQNYWDASNALQLLRGTLWPGTPPFVESEIYIGDNKGGFPRRQVRVRLQVRPELVPTTNDSHSLVTYYALAMDARRLQCDPGIVGLLLSRARSIAEDIRRRTGSLTGDVAQLRAAIEQDLTALDTEPASP